MTRLCGCVRVKAKKEIFIMTDMERLISAKECMDRLSNGIDPISDEVLPGDTVLNNVDLSRNFFFVSDILRQVIENGGSVAKRAQRRSYLPPFMLPSELHGEIEITAAPAMIRQFTERINSLIDENTMQKLKVAAVTGWLVDNGFLCEEVVNDKKRKKPTKEGEMLGIYSEEREGQYGRYLAILYNESAQRHIINNLEQIATISNI